MSDEQENAVLLELSIRYYEQRMGWEIDRETLAVLNPYMPRWIAWATARRTDPGEPEVRINFVVLATGYTHMTINNGTETARLAQWASTNLPQ